MSTSTGYFIFELKRPTWFITWEQRRCDNVSVCMCGLMRTCTCIRLLTINLLTCFCECIVEILPWPGAAPLAAGQPRREGGREHAAALPAVPHTPEQPDTRHTGEGQPARPEPRATVAGMAAVRAPLPRHLWLAAAAGAPSPRRRRGYGCGGGGDGRGASRGHPPAAGGVSGDPRGAKRGEGGHVPGSRQGAPAPQRGIVSSSGGQGCRVRRPVGHHQQ